MYQQNNKNPSCFVLCVYYAVREKVKIEQNQTNRRKTNYMKDILIKMKQIN